MTGREKQAHSESHAGSVPMIVFVSRLIYFVYGVVTFVILLRILLLILAANRGNGFVDFVYDISNTLVAPFHGMFSYTPTYGASVFELSSLVALIVYAFIMWGLIALLILGSRQDDEL